MLSAHEISCQRGRQHLWGQLNVNVSAGEILFVAGANGSGKSSLLKILAGLSLPSEGTVHWQGQTIQKNPALYQSELLYLGHQNPLKPELNALENLDALLCLHGHCAPENDIQAALSTWGLLDRTTRLPTKQLSQGQKQRVTLTLLTLLPKSLWILDEPFNSLDMSGAQILQQLLENQLQHNRSVVLTSHLHMNAGQIAPSLQASEKFLQL